MKFKLDENFGVRALRVFLDHGHEADTVRDEGLGGAEDRVLFDRCIVEQRCLITLDLDFADVVRFPPHQGAGIAVFRLPPSASRKLMDESARLFLRMLHGQSITGRLWIVEAGRIRIHADTSPEADAEP